MVFGVKESTSPAVLDPLLLPEQGFSKFFSRHTHMLVWSAKCSGWCCQGTLHWDAELASVPRTHPKTYLPDFFDFGTSFSYKGSTLACWDDEPQRYGRFACHRAVGHRGVYVLESQCQRALAGDLSLLVSTEGLTANAQAVCGDLGSVQAAVARFCGEGSPSELCRWSTVSVKQLVPEEPFGCLALQGPCCGTRGQD